MRRWSREEGLFGRRRLLGGLASAAALAVGGAAARALSEVPRATGRALRRSAGRLRAGLPRLRVKPLRREDLYREHDLAG